MREIDRVALQVYDRLRQASDRLAQDFDPYANLAGVFFHQAMIHYTNFVCLRSVDEPVVQDILFPFTNSNYVAEPFAIEFGAPDLVQEHGATEQALARALALWPFGRKVALGSGVAVDTRKLMLGLAGRRRVSLEPGAKAFILELAAQRPLFEACLHDLADLVQAPRGEVMARNFIAYLDRFVTDQPAPLQGDVFVVGSCTTLKNRLIAANYRHDGRPVLTLAHGEQSNLTLNDPMTGYGEMSYCTHFVDYGTKDLGLSSFNRPLAKAPVILRRRSDLIRSIYSNSSVAHRPLGPGSRVLYVPTLLSTHRRYGPFRDMSARQYLTWQTALLSSGTSLGLEIDYKAHPDSKVEPPAEARRVIRENLTETFPGYDAYILDYPSTALSILCATDKPVLYFDLGLMNLHSTAMEELRSRMFWREIDWNKDLATQALHVMAEYSGSDCEFRNTYTPNYCLTSVADESEIDAVRRFILSL